jgi:hypothetical protein
MFLGLVQIIDHFKPIHCHIDSIEEKLSREVGRDNADDWNYGHIPHFFNKIRLITKWYRGVIEKIEKSKNHENCLTCFHP